MDRYRDFSHLRKHEIEFQDYRIRLREGDSGIVILAPHGGKIERGTTQIAVAVAGGEHTFYSFEGLKPCLKSNRALHITSNNFDEPTAVALVNRADRVVAIHGAKGMESAVYLGGLDTVSRDELLESCRSRGFWACNDPSPSRQGKGLTNICNRGISGKGLQVELTFGLRQRMFERGPDNARWNSNRLFDRLVQCFREIL